MITELQGKEDEIRKALVNGLFPMLPGSMLLSEANAMVPILMAAYEIGYIAALPAEKKGDRRDVFDDYQGLGRTVKKPSCSELQAVIRQKDKEFSQLCRQGRAK